MTGPTPRPEIMAIQAYAAGESKVQGVNRIIKLSSNEGAFGPPPGVRLPGFGPMRMAWGSPRWPRQRMGDSGGPRGMLARSWLRPSPFAVIGDAVEHPFFPPMLLRDLPRPQLGPPAVFRFWFPPEAMMPGNYLPRPGDDRSATVENGSDSAVTA